MAVTVVVAPLSEAGPDHIDISSETRTASSTSTSPETALTEEAAHAKAVSTNEKVEIISQRGESSEVYATPEGHLEAVQHLRPVRARVDGEWKPVDNTLHRRGDGAIVPGATTVDMVFSGGGNGPLVTLGQAGRTLSMSWPKSLPAPTLQGDTATYASVLPGVDLQVRANTDSFSHLLVVKSAEAALHPELAELKLAIGGKGLKVIETGSGGLQAVDINAGGVAFEAAQPVMWDSPVSPAAEESPAAAEKKTSVTSAEGSQETGTAAEGPGDGAMLAPIGVEVTNGGSELRLTPDQALLKDPDTRYPVYIDPQWYTPKAGEWTMVSRYWADSPQWKFNGKSDAGMGYCGWDYCAPYDLKRLFYKFPTSRFAGKTILSAQFIAKETYSASCDGRTVQLWRTKSFSSSTTWNSSSDNWLEHLDTRDVAHGYSASCPADDVEFNAKKAVQYAADHSSSYTSFGLRAGYEDDKYGWKRFSDDAYLRVQYNRPPKQLAMSQLRMEYGGTCKKPDYKARVRTLGKIYAEDVTDPDGDTVSVEFEAKWDSGDGQGLIRRWNPPKTSFKKSGSTFSISLPSSVPANKTVHWYARTYDGAQYSPWSYTGSATGCYFVYDLSVPAAPSIASGDYPESNPENPDDPWYDGVGRYGYFTLDSSATDVNQYRFGINGDPTSPNSIQTSSGAAKTARIKPVKSGVNFVTAQAFDQAGNGSEIRTYQFRVKAGQPERAQWRLDESAGVTQAGGSSPPRTAELHGATPGVEGVLGTAVSFDGVDDYASTDIPTVDTSRGFAVSAWVKLSRMPDTAAIIAAQPGNNSPGFELYYSKAYDRWAFNQYSADTADAKPVRVAPDTAGGVSADRWTHLVGMHDMTLKELRLYIDAQLVGTVPYTTAWDARRGLQIGAGSYNGSQGSYFPGVIDELQIFDKPVTQAEVTALFSKEPIGNGRPARTVFNLDEPATATQITGYADVKPMVFKGGVKPGTAGADGNAAEFDGVDDYADAGAPHVNTEGSFSVAAWAKLPATRPSKAAMVVAQSGNYRSGLELYYSAAYGWSFNQYSADTADATPIRAAQGSTDKVVPDEWTHLLGVHDTVANELRLYVNGAWVATTPLGKAWYAGKSTLIGAGRYSGSMSNFFPGQIDDVRMFDRPLSATEAKELFKNRPLVKGRWKLDTASGSPVVSPDDSTGRRGVTLSGDAVIDDSGSSNYVGTGSLLLDGDGDYAATGTSPVGSTTSFTATAWVATAARPDHKVTVMSLAGSVNSGFAVRYVPDSKDPANAGRWQLEMTGADTSGADTVTSEHANFQNNTMWNHIAVVYDAFSDQMRLYVDGELEQALCLDSDDDGAPDDASCTERVSWNNDVLTFNATGGLQLGRSRTAGTWGEYWPGAIDDVWVFQGAASEVQIARLANGEDLATSPGP
ncbi:LamG domain-containing protein [Streptomyces atacamensis]|uniref:LamG domain-containing protein n=1 Tax=Streptomyces atacamensis TaxID=531966 RepID=UPI00399C90E1